MNTVNGGLLIGGGLFLLYLAINGKLEPFIKAFSDAFKS